jgi:hypothetical protein
MNSYYCVPYLAKRTFGKKAKADSPSLPMTPDDRAQQARQANVRIIDAKKQIIVTTTPVNNTFIGNDLL